MDQDRRFVDLPLDKHDWSPSPVLGQVVLVTSVDASGAVDVAPKSWVSMAAFAGPVVAFGCNVEHRTHHNIRSTGGFVVNVPDSSLAERTWGMLGAHGDDRISRSGLTLVPGRRPQLPVIAECRAHLECDHYQTVEFAGGEVFIFGTVRSVTVDEACLAAALPDRYQALDPFFFLEGGWYATLEPARRATPL